MKPLHLIACTCALLIAAAGHAADVAPRPSAGCNAATLETGRELQRTIDVDGTKRAYILDVPDSIQAKKPAPLLFDFHGFGHSAAGVWKVSGFKPLAARDGVITVYPDGLPVHLLGRDAPGWEIFKTEGNRDLAFTARLLDQLERTYCVDQARVFSTGFSNGAYFSYLLACRMADRFAAIAPVSGGLVSTECNPGRAVPVLIHHGRQDDLVPIAQARAARDAWIQRNGCRAHASDGCEWHRECRDGSEVEYCEGDFPHHWPPEATERIWAFFRAHPMPRRE
ncbi:MAG TPA: PHB depolymerase family esterase [Candidatus Margulisiibacteriota bacterium]|nr:PHB depolymerase family esterase [Candidatus Margulisiibacteriota bacterium]